MTLTLMPQPPGHCWQTEATQLSGPGGHGASASSLSISFSRTHPDRASPAKAAVENFKKSRRSSSISRVHYLAESGLHGSPMTAIAVGVDLFLPMARDAPVHVDRLRWPPWRGIARFDLPMARLALLLPQDDVAPVGEEGVVGNPVESDPTDLFLLLGILGELLLFLHVLGLLGVSLVAEPQRLPRRSRAGSIEDGGNDQEKNDGYGQRRPVHETFSPLYMEGSVTSPLPLGTCDPGSLDRPDQFPRVKVLQEISAGPRPICLLLFGLILVRGQHQDPGLGGGGGGPA